MSNHSFKAGAPQGPFNRVAAANIVFNVAAMTTPPQTLAKASPGRATALLMVTKAIRELMPAYDHVFIIFRKISFNLKGKITKLVFCNNNRHGILSLIFVSDEKFNMGENSLNAGALSCFIRYFDILGAFGVFWKCVLNKCDISGAFSESEKNAFVETPTERHVFANAYAKSALFMAFLRKATPKSVFAAFLGGSRKPCDIKFSDGLPVIPGRKYLSE